jgi:serine phosphatase RsbU (regulator of sigma subunit)
VEHSDDGPPAGRIDWHAAFRALPGQAVSGDLHVVAPTAAGVVVAAIDGLGHGEEAAAASRIAASEIAKYSEGSLVSLLLSCHNSMRGTRGAVMNIASLDFRHGTLCWLGIGNVEGVLLQPNAKQYLRQRPGIVGCHIPSLDESVIPLLKGDTLILATDGIRSNFLENANISNSPRRIADDILLRSGKLTDDALVLVVRYLGASQ